MEDWADSSNSDEVKENGLDKFEKEGSEEMENEQIEKEEVENEEIEKDEVENEEVENEDSSEHEGDFDVEEKGEDDSHEEYEEKMEEEEVAEDRDFEKEEEGEKDSDEREYEQKEVEEEEADAVAEPIEEVPAEPDGDFENNTFMNMEGNTKKEEALEDHEFDEDRGDDDDGEESNANEYGEEQQNNEENAEQEEGREEPNENEPCEEQQEDNQEPERNEEGIEQPQPTEAEDAGVEKEQEEDKPKQEYLEKESVPQTFEPNVQQNTVDKDIIKEEEKRTTQNYAAKPMQQTPMQDANQMQKEKESIDKGDKPKDDESKIGVTYETAKAEAYLLGGYNPRNINLAEGGRQNRNIVFPSLAPTGLPIPGREKENLNMLHFDPEKVGYKYNTGVNPAEGYLFIYPHVSHNYIAPKIRKKRVGCC